MQVELRDNRDREAALERLRAAEPHLVDAVSAEACVGPGTHVLDILEDGRLVGVCAVAIVGRCATINLVVSAGDFPLEQLQLLEDSLRAKGVTHLAFFTQRPGLIRKMLGAGFHVRECEMEKEL